MTDNPKPTAPALIDAAQRVTNISLKEMASKSREPEVVRARRLLSLALYDHASRRRSTIEIAHVLGGTRKNASTINHRLGMARQLCQSDDRFRLDLERIVELAMNNPRSLLR